MTIVPTVEAKRWVVTTLAADAQLAGWVGGAIYEVPAPVDAPDPFLALALSRRPMDVRTNGAIVAMTTLWLTVVAARHGTSALAGGTSLEAIDARVTWLLDRRAGTTATATILACVREGPALLLPVIDERGGAQYAQVGSEWRLWVQ